MIQKEPTAKPCPYLSRMLGAISIAPEKLEPQKEKTEVKNEAVIHEE